jgi:hypothetical protein
MRTQLSPLDENPTLPSWVLIKRGELGSHQEGKVGFSSRGECWVLIKREELGFHQEGRVGFSSRGESWALIKRGVLGSHQEGRVGVSSSPLLMKTQHSPLDESPTLPS